MDMDLRHLNIGIPHVPSLKDSKSSSKTSSSGSSRQKRETTCIFMIIIGYVKPLDQPFDQSLYDLPTDFFLLMQEMGFNLYTTISFSALRVHAHRVHVYSQSITRSESWIARYWICRIHVTWPRFTMIFFSFKTKCKHDAKLFMCGVALTDNFWSVNDAIFPGSVGINPWYLPLQWSCRYSVVGRKMIVRLISQWCWFKTSDSRVLKSCKKWTLNRCGMVKGLN